MRVLLIDNYDSFTWNLVHLIGGLGAEVDVWRNDALTAEEALAGDHDAIVLSPGPCTPNEAGICLDVIREGAGKKPIFGVCLGLQSIAVAYGGVVNRAPELLHGKTSAVVHDGTGVFAGLPSPLTTTRYHSLALDPATVPDELEVTARTESGVIMAVRHRSLPVESVQFHPESVLTEGGYQMLANWLAVCGDAEAPARAVGLSPLTSADLTY